MLYKRGKVWWTKIKWQGGLIRRSTLTGNKELALKIERKILYEMAEGIWFEKNPADHVSFGEVWEKYMKEEAPFVSQGNAIRAAQCAKNFLPHFGGLKLSEVSPARLSTYKAKRLSAGVCASTVVRELQFVRRVFSLSKREWQLIKQSPFEFFAMPKQKNNRVKFLDPGQFETMLSNCPEWIRPIVILARHTGMRKGNVLTLRWDEVDLLNRVIHLERTKNGCRLSIPLTEIAFNVLVGVKNSKIKHLNCPYVFQQDGKLYSPHQVSMAFKRACSRSGLIDFRFHDLRHDFASSLVQRGNDLYLVQGLLGHKDGRMTQRYAHLRFENLRKAVETLEWGHKKGHSEDEKGAAVYATP